jgi:GNAT superfamily N-acetyltransferase
VIRQVGPDDWAHWRALRLRSLDEDRAAFAESVTAWTGDLDTEARWRERLSNGDTCFLAYDGERPVGMVAAEHRTDGAVELISMWVAPEARGVGVGAELIDRVLGLADGAPVGLRVIPGNDPAIRAYERAGFTLLPGDPDCDGCRRMERPISFPHRLVVSAALPGQGLSGRFRRVGLLGALLDTNRRGTHAEVPADAAVAGMAWQDGDARTPRWWPQGITTSADAVTDPPEGTFEGHDVVLVSWYARGRLRRFLGSRVSVVDWRDDEPPRYRHVLMVEPRRRWGFTRLRPVRVHAGGIVWYGPHLFVAGSAGGIRVFRLEDIVRVRNRVRLKGYRYALPQSTRYAAEADQDTPGLTYSFLSLERGATQDRLVAGEYGRRGGSHRLLRYPIDRETGLLRGDERGRVSPTDLHDQQVERMQGATVAEGVWFITASTGEGRPGDLWVGRPGDYTRHRGVLPTGPEDITYLPQRRQLWTLTEWPGRRWLLWIDRDRWTH